MLVGNEFFKDINFQKILIMNHKLRCYFLVQLISNDC